jgi:hypothetical protein
MTAAADEAGGAGTVSVDGRVIYSAPQRNNSFRRSPSWRDEILQAVGAPFTAERPAAWWLQTETWTQRLAQLLKQAHPTFTYDDFRAMGEIALKLQELCKRWVDYSGDTENPAFALIGDLEVLVDWAAKGSSKPNLAVGRPSKDQERDCFHRLGEQFRAGFGERYPVSGAKAGPFTNFVIACLKVEAGVDITASQIREKMRDRSSR